VPVHQQTLGDHGRIDPQAHPECQIDAFGELVHDAVGDEYVDADVGVGRLEGADERGEQRVGDAGRRGQPERAGDTCQLVRDHIIDRLADIDAALGVLQNLGPDLGEP
jgi:hypothetical protein